MYVFSTLGALGKEFFLSNISLRSETGSAECVGGPSVHGFRKHGSLELNLLRQILVKQQMSSSYIYTIILSNSIITRKDNTELYLSTSLQSCNFL